VSAITLVGTRVAFVENKSDTDNPPASENFPKVWLYTLLLQFSLILPAVLYGRENMMSS
jgi:hypothetical protein